MRLIDADAIPWEVDGVGFIPVIGKDEIDEMPAWEEKMFPDDFPDGFYIHKGNNLYSVDLPMDIPFCKKVNLMTGEVTTQLEMVPVVRCKDCQFWHTEHCPLEYADCMVDAHDFCAWGGRREDEAD